MNSNSQECNAFADASRNFQKSGLGRHGKSDDHQLMEAVEQRQKELATAVIKANEFKGAPCMLKATLILARGDLPDTKFSSLLEAQVEHFSVHFSFFCA